jgi:hypothetical protein
MVWTGRRLLWRFLVVWRELPRFTLDFHPLFLFLSDGLKCIGCGFPEHFVEGPIK